MNENAGIAELATARLHGHFDPAAVFLEEFDLAIAAEVERSGFPVEQWFRNGNQKPLAAIDTWKERGPESVRQFIRWYEGSDHKVWVTPDGRPAIELELRAKFGDIEVHGFVDLITISPMGLCIVDTKSGWRKPDNVQQLAIYAGLVELTWGPQWRPLWGTHFLTRGTGKQGAAPEDKTYFQPPVPLSEYRHSVEFFTGELAKFEDAVQRGIFVARPSSDCNVCGVSHACIAVGGTESSVWDPADPGFVHQSIHQGASAA